MKVRSYFPVTLTIDDEEIVLRIKRMTLDEFFDYNAMLARVGRLTSQRFTSALVDTPEKHEDWLASLTPEKREEYQAAADADETEARDFILDVFSRFVTVERGLTEETLDGKECSITEGEDLLRVFGARQDVLEKVMEAVRRENTLDASQKKALKSPAASSPSSNGRARARAGRKRATTARRAVKEGSAGNGDATGGKKPRSGSTEREDVPSSPTPAPSLNRRRITVFGMISSPIRTDRGSMDGREPLSSNGSPSPDREGLEISRREQWKLWVSSNKSQRKSSRSS